MASITDKGVASLAPGWESLPVSSLKDLRTSLSFRAMLQLRTGTKRGEKESANCFNLVHQVRNRINELEGQPLVHLPKLEVK